MKSKKRFVFVAMLLEQNIRVVIDHQQSSLAKRLVNGRKLRPYAFSVIGDKEIDVNSLEIQTNQFH